MTYAQQVCAELARVDEASAFARYGARDWKQYVVVVDGLLGGQKNEARGVDAASFAEVVLSRDQSTGGDG